MSNSMFYTGLSGLSVAQAALVTTGHNTANVNTPGYNRQAAQIASSGGVYMPSVGFFGTGAHVATIGRSYDHYLASQLNQAQALSEALNTHYTQISRIDNLLADQTIGLAPQLQSFFTSVQGVANTPADPAARQQMISSAQALTNQFRSMSRYLVDLNSSVNNQIAGSVEQINAYAGQIANLNKQIGLISGIAGDQPPNDLLDQRDSLVSALGKLIGTKVVVQDGGQYNVFIGNGQTLVLGNQALAMRAVDAAADPSRTAVALVDAGGNLVEIRDSVLSGGSLGGLLQFRNDTLATTQNSLGRIAMVLADTFNAQHRLGVDLSGALGQDFFSQADLGVISSGRNKGDLTLTAALSDSGKLTASDYTLSVTNGGAGLAYTLTRLSDSAVVGTYGDADFPVVFDGVTLSVASGSAQVGDSFLIQPTRTGARDFDVVLTDVVKLAAASPIITADTPTNQGSGAISAGSVDANYLATPIGAGGVALAYDSATNSFSGFPAAANVTVTQPDGTVTTYPAGTPVPYTAGASMSFDGITVNIKGAPSNGDTFTIDPNTAGVSDGRNALLLGALQNVKTVGSNTASFNEAYAQLVSAVGNRAMQIQIANESQTSLAAQIRLTQQSVSGVNLDEEAANLLMFQQMYQANAKVIQTASTIFDAVLGIQS